MMGKRKRFILMLIVLVLLTALLPTAAYAQDEELTLRMAWWGGDTRHEKYNILADMYEALHPNITIEREFSDWTPYWERLATQVAGGNPPDIIHLTTAQIGQYASLGALAELNPYVDASEIDLSHFPQGVIDSGAIDGTIYMVSLGNSAHGLHWNTRMFEEAGVEPPTEDWTWDDFKETALALSEALGPDVYAINDSGGWEGVYDIFLHQRDKDIYNDDWTGLGFERQDLIDLWSLWAELREAGAVPPADVNLEFSGVTHCDSMLATGLVAMHPMSGNQHKLFQNCMDDELGLAVLPRGTSPDTVPGDTIGGGYIAMSSQTEYPEEVAAFINWMVNDPEVARVYNAEHGPPGSLEMQEVIADQIDPADVRLAGMMTIINPTAEAAPVRPPFHGEIVAAFSRFYDETAFGRMTVEEAVDAFFEEADFIIN